MRQVALLQKGKVPLIQKNLMLAVANVFFRSRETTSLRRLCSMFRAAQASASGFSLKSSHG